MTSLIEIGKRFFDEFQNAPDFLDADKIAGVLPVEIGEVEDHHIEGLPEFDPRFLQNFLIFAIDPNGGLSDIILCRVKGMLYRRRVSAVSLVRRAFSMILPRTMGTSFR